MSVWVLTESRGSLSQGFERECIGLQRRRVLMCSSQSSHKSLDRTQCTAADEVYYHPLVRWCGGRVSADS